MFAVLNKDSENIALERLISENGIQKVNKDKVMAGNYLRSSFQNAIIITSGKRSKGTIISQGTGIRKDHRMNTKRLKHLGDSFIEMLKEG